MALEFVTSKQGKAHISSSDWRSLNRGNFGTGKYILEDTANNSINDFTVSPTEGTITIPPRSLMWSGSHIRNTSSLSLEYVVPTVSATVSVWLHYTKDADTSIENLEMVVTVDNQPSPILDEIEDSTLEAYTLLFSFLHNVETTTADNKTVAFTQVNSLANLLTKDAYTNSRIDYLAEVIQNDRTNANNKISAEETARKNADVSFDSRLSNAESKITALQKKNIVLSSISTGSLSTYTSTQKITDFSMLMVKYKNVDSSFSEYYFIPAIQMNVGDSYYHVIRDYKISGSGLSLQINSYFPRIVITTYGDYFTVSFQQNSGGSFQELIGIY